MLSLEIFSEILIVGFLLLLGVSPMLIRFSKNAKDVDGFLPGLSALEVNSVTIVALVIITYTLGVAGNRLIDDALDEAAEVEIGKRKVKIFGILDPGAKYKEHFEKTWAKEHDSEVKLFKVAEFALRERNEATAAWFNRHKSYVRVLRGAFFSIALLLLTMTIYRVSRPKIPRYHARHFLVALILLAVFFFAFKFETEKYKKRIYELYTGEKLPKMVCQRENVFLGKGLEAGKESITIRTRDSGEKVALYVPFRRKDDGTSVLHEELSVHVMSFDVGANVKVQWEWAEKKRWIRRLTRIEE